MQCSLSLLVLFFLTSPFLRSDSSAIQQPVIHYAAKIGGSGADQVVGVATDASGNVYIAGSTASLDFPVRKALQPKPGGSTFFRLDGNQISASLSSGISLPSHLAASVLQPGLVYASDSGVLRKSTDGGDNWTAVAGIGGFVSDIEIDPTDPNIVYAGTFDNGLYKSSDGGVSWSAVNNGLEPRSDGTLRISQIAIDPNNTQVVLAISDFGRLYRSSDGGANFRAISTGATSVSFDPSRKGVVFATVNASPGVFKSTDGGATFAPQAQIWFAFQSVFADPFHPGTVFGTLGQELFRSTDDGQNFTALRSGAFSPFFAADPVSKTLYLSLGTQLARSADDFTTVESLGPSIPLIQGIAIGAGPTPGGPSRVYTATGATSDGFVAKLDPDGNVIYATYLGGSAADSISAITADTAGNVYVAGFTFSSDFPVTKGAFLAASPGKASPGLESQPVSASFLAKLAPDGTLVYSTYFASGKTVPKAIAVNAAGELFLTGYTHGDLPVTPGVLQSGLIPACGQIPCVGPGIGNIAPFFPTIASNAFVTVFSTYYGTGTEAAAALAIDPDGNSYFAGGGTVWIMNASGTALKGSTRLDSNTSINALQFDASGHLYLAGTTNSLQFYTSPGAFQRSILSKPSLPGQGGGGSADAFVMRMDANLSIQYSTLLGGEGQDVATSLVVDGNGIATIAGSSTSRSFPLQTPVQSTFSSSTGFIARVNADASALLYSTYLGDSHVFQINGLALDPSGNAVFVGNTATVISATAPYTVVGPPNAYVGRVDAAPPPKVVINSVASAASILGGGIAPGETLVVRGRGLASDAQVLVDGVALDVLTRADGAITVSLPADYVARIGQPAAVQIRSGGQLSNTLIAPIVSASPGVYSADGSGFGQGFILNEDGTRNSSSNPIAENGVITICATGVGPESAGLPSIAVFIDGFYASGVDAKFGPVDGLPGSVYQVRVIVPHPADWVDRNPNLLNFKMPPTVPVTIQVGGSTSQVGLSLSVK